MVTTIEAGYVLSLCILGSQSEHLLKYFRAFASRQS